MVSDLLDITWEIMPKEEIERTKGVNLNFLEYLSIKQSIKQFIRNADKRRVNVGPYRPYMLNLFFFTKQGCQDIYRKTGQYGVKILLEISQKWEIDLTVNVDTDEVQQSIKLFLKTTRNMYLWDIQYKLWHARVATNSKLYQMNIKNTENCEYCQQRETNVHAFILCERSQRFWREVSIFLARLGYRNFRLEHKIIILGDTNKDLLFKLIIIMGKKVIYQTRGTRNQFSMRHLERILEIERESEEQFAINNDILEMYERKWEKYLKCKFTFKMKKDMF